MMMMTVMTMMKYDEDDADNYDYDDTDNGDGDD